MRNLLYRRAKPWALSAVAVAMAVLQAVALPAQACGVVCRATYLPNPIGTPDSPWRGLGLAINSAGDVAGYTVGEANQQRAFFYHQGQNYLAGGLAADQLGRSSASANSDPFGPFGQVRIGGEVQQSACASCALSRSAGFSQRPGGGLGERPIAPTWQLVREQERRHGHQSERLDRGPFDFCRPLTGPCLYRSWCRCESRGGRAGRGRWQQPCGGREFGRSGDRHILIGHRRRLGVPGLAQRRRRQSGRLCQGLGRHRPRGRRHRHQRERANLGHLKPQPTAAAQPGGRADLGRPAGLVATWPRPAIGTAAWALRRTNFWM